MTMDENIIYFALAMSLLTNAVLAFVVIRMSQGLAVSVPPQVIPYFVELLKYGATLTPTKADDNALATMFPELPQQEVQRIVDQVGRDVAQAMESAAS
jgi:lauroyl/myristoyl acyltransferase